MVLALATQWHPVVQPFNTTGTLLQTLFYGLK